MTIANSKGERGQPCLVPFAIQNLSDFVPIAKTAADGEE